jgi:hypothetical protein
VRFVRKLGPLSLLPGLNGRRYMVATSDIMRRCYLPLLIFSLSKIKWQIK